MDSPTPGESKLHPICIDSSPLSVPVSPVKIASSKALPKCRYELDYVLQLLVFYLKFEAHFSRKLLFSLEADSPAANLEPQ